MTKNLFGLILLSVLIISCSGKKEPQLNTPEQAAIQYTQYLNQGNIDEYLSAQASLDSASATYKEMMKTVCKEFASSIKNMSDSLVNIQPHRTIIEEDNKYATVFLSLKYKQGYTHEIMMPLFNDNGKWRLR